MGIKNAVLAVIAVAAAIPLASQAQPPPPFMFDIEQLTVLLDLDAYQKGEVERILSTQRMRSGDGGLSFADRRSQIDADRAEVLDELQQILTVEQLEKFEILSNGPRRRPGPPFGGGE